MPSKLFVPGVRTLDSQIRVFDASRERRDLINRCWERMEN